VSVTRAALALSLSRALGCQQFGLPDAGAKQRLSLMNEKATEQS
jgi:hypothetical protein